MEFPLLWYLIWLHLASSGLIRFAIALYALVGKFGLQASVACRQVWPRLQRGLQPDGRAELCDAQLGRHLRPAHDPSRSRHSRPQQTRHQDQRQRQPDPHPQAARSVSPVRGRVWVSLGRGRGERGREEGRGGSVLRRDAVQVSAEDKGAGCEEWDQWITLWPRSGLIHYCTLSYPIYILPCFCVSQWMLRSVLMFLSVLSDDLRYWKQSDGLFVFCLSSVCWLFLFIFKLQGILHLVSLISYPSHIQFIMHSWVSSMINFCTRCRG